MGVILLYILDYSKCQALLGWSLGNLSDTARATDQRTVYSFLAKGC